MNRFWNLRVALVYMAPFQGTIWAFLWLLTDSQTHANGAGVYAFVLALLLMAREPENVAEKFLKDE